MGLNTFLFDLDGTIIDSIELILRSYRHTMELHRCNEPMPPDDLWIKGLGTPLWAQFGQITEDKEEIERMVQTYRTYNLTHHDALVHPYRNHREMHVGHRRVKTLMKSGGYVADKSLAKAASGFARRVEKHEKEEIAERAAGGAVAPARLDKRARGGATSHPAGCTCAACGGKVAKRAQGGGIHQITPSKRKPHTNINIVNVTHRPRPRPVVPPIGGAIPGPALPVPLGAGLPMRASGGKIGKLWEGTTKGGAASGRGRLAISKKTGRDYP